MFAGRCVVKRHLWVHCRVPTFADEVAIVQPRYVAAYVLLDGADIPLQHLVLGWPADEVRMGMRVRASAAAARRFSAATGTAMRAVLQHLADDGYLSIPRNNAVALARDCFARR